MDFKPQGKILLFLKIVFRSGLKQKFLSVHAIRGEQKRICKVRAKDLRLSFKDIWFKINHPFTTDYPLLGIQWEVLSSGLRYAGLKM